MSNDVVQYQPVPFQQMERMANAVAKSALFGVKTQEAALALMMLADAERIHPMTAVRDYHIINGRPSMKAEAMLARFHEAGGKVQWHKLDDAEAEATFSHRDGGEIRIKWDIQRATKAGLANRDLWKTYPRAMLRSRVVSEGIRTVLPGVLAGKYTPEEALHIETVEPVSVEAFIAGAERPGLLQASIDAGCIEIKEAKTEDELKRAFADNYRVAKDKGDERTMNTFKLAYDARKGELQSPPEGPQAEGEAVI